MNKLNRNITIVVIILIIVLLAGYLVWLRGRYLTPENSATQTVENVTPAPTIVATIQPTASASASATPKVSPTASSSATVKATVKPLATKIPAETASPSALVK